MHQQRRNGERLTIDDVRAIREERGRINHAIYKDTYLKCIAKIEKCVRMFPTSTMTSFSIPVFIMGKPSYDPRHCQRYVKEKLQHGGFEITIPDGHVLYIEWKKKK